MSLFYCIEAELEYTNSQCSCAKLFSSFQFPFSAPTGHLALISCFFLFSESQTINSLQLTDIQLSLCQDGLVSCSSLCLWIVKCSPTSQFNLTSSCSNGSQEYGSDAFSMLDLNWMERCADRNLTKFNKEKYKVLHLERNNSQQQYMLGSTQPESSLSGKDLWLLVDTRLNTSQQCPCGKDSE